MNVCIVTVYNSENCGSFLQAYSLYRVLQHLGHRVSFLKRSPMKTSHSPVKHLRQSVKRAGRLRFGEIQREWLQYANFSKAAKTLPVAGMDSQAYQNADCMVIGSDTVWNFQSKYFREKSPIYLGERFRGKHVISYAASIGNTPYAKLTESAVFARGLQNFSAVSVRDNYSAAIVGRLLGQKPVITADPTMLLTREDFAKIEPPMNEEGCILIYHFGKLSQRASRAILDLKRHTGRKLISFGEYRPWCDGNIVYDPYLFLSYFHHAGFIITNTYHGTIFSILYEKKFADYGKGKQKVVDLLRGLGLMGRLCDEGEDLIHMHQSGIDYAAVKARIKEIREASISFLKQAIGEAYEIEKSV